MNTLIKMEEIKSDSITSAIMEIRTNPNFDERIHKLANKYGWGINVTIENVATHIIFNKSDFK